MTIIYANEVIARQGRIIQQSTGVKDRKGVEIFEGDIIKFKYQVGDFAWEDMDEDEIARQEEMLGREYIGVICRNTITKCNLEVECYGQGAALTIFPLGYCLGSKVIGNIFENRELLCGK